MRTIWRLGLILVLAVPSFAQPASSPGHEQRRLAFWCGEWSYEIPARGGGGAVSGGWTGRMVGAGFFVRYEETFKPASGPALETLGVVGYEPLEGVYFWHRYWSNGQVDRARGWLHGAVWTFDFGESRADGKLQRTQVIMTEEAPDRLAFRWQRSVEGQPWEVLSEGRARKLR
jgi:hypothetical protein